MSTIIEKPMLFSAPMVLAILEGRKTQTRRVVKLPARIADGYGPANWEAAKLPQYAEKDEYCFADSGHPIQSYPWLVKCPHPVGSRIWVRETWCKWREGWDRSNHIIYRADMRDKSGYQFAEDEMTEKWHPSIFMPRWASRLTLEVTDVRVQRLQDITEADAIDEGMLRLPCPMYAKELDEWESGGKVGKPPLGKTPRQTFEALWDSINGTGSWDANPWVWAYTFKQVQP